MEWVTIEREGKPMARDPIDMMNMYALKSVTINNDDDDEP